MTRTSTQNKARADACGRYREVAGNECELFPVICRDEDAVTWIKKEAWIGLEVHHIAGRGKNSIHEYACNLILLDSNVHSWLTRQNIVCGEIACWFAKYKRHLREIQNGTYPKPALADQLHWNPAAIKEIVIQDGLLGRLHWLAGKTTHPMYLGMAKQLIDVLEKQCKKN